MSEWKISDLWLDLQPFIAHRCWRQPYNLYRYIQLDYKTPSYSSSLITIYIPFIVKVVEIGFTFLAKLIKSLFSLWRFTLWENREQTRLLFFRIGCLRIRYVYLNLCRVPVDTHNIWLSPFISILFWFGISFMNFSWRMLASHFSTLKAFYWSSVNVVFWTVSDHVNEWKERALWKQIKNKGKAKQTLSVFYFINIYY